MPFIFSANGIKSFALGRRMARNGGLHIQMRPAGRLNKYSD
jgi:hypothetical protein